jgi:hypothetical protein
VIIGAKDGKLLIEKSDRCRGFGYGREAVDKMLAKHPKAEIDGGVRILKAALQHGRYATKYSNVFDLRTGEIQIFNLHQATRGIRLNLAAELAKGPHYYEIPDLKSQLKQNPKPLLKNMTRLPLNLFSPIADDAPDLTQRITKIFRDTQWTSGDFTPEVWKEIGGNEQAAKDEIHALGRFREIVRVEILPQDAPRTFRYRIDLDNVTILENIVLDTDNRIASMNTEDIEQRAGVR